MKKREFNTHFSHCYQGKYKTSCKYGDKKCPAKPYIRCGGCKELYDEDIIYEIETPNIIIYLCLDCAVKVEDDLMHLAYKTTTCNDKCMIKSNHIGVKSDGDKNNG